MQSVLGAHIDALTWDDAINRISAYASARESRYVCICNVHSVITATRDPTFLSTINNADMATPDGAPIAWSLRMMGYAAQERINGPDLMWRYLEVAQQLGQRIFFVGSTQATLCKLRQSIMHHFPHTHICGMLAPPFRALSVLENQEIIGKVKISGRLYPRQTSDSARAGEDEISRIDPALIVGETSLSLFDGYVVATAEATPLGQEILTTRIPAPQLKSKVPGNYWQHISYVFVWWLMGLLVLFAPFYNEVAVKLKHEST